MVCIVHVSAQSPEVHDEVENSLHNDEDVRIPESFLENREEMILDPVDLNLADREALYRSGLFTPFQVEVLLRYRMRYGPLYSIYELAGLPGFSHSGVQEMAPYMVAGKTSTQPHSRGAGGTVILEGSTTRPPGSDVATADSLEQDAGYPGDPFRVSARIRVNPTGFLTLGAAYEKDPGERYFLNGMPEHFTGYMAYRGRRIPSTLIIGNFRIHHGWGLVNGTGFLHSPAAMSLRPQALPSATPFASLAETRYGSGLAAQVDLGKLRLMAWSTLGQLDLSLHDFRPGGAQVDWEERERSTGLHRSPSETGGAALGYRSHLGFVASRRDREWHFQVMGGSRMNGLTRAGKDSLGTDPGPSVFGTGSFYGGYFGTRLMVTGEVACSGASGMAFLLTAGFRFSDFLTGIWVIHHYGRTYNGMFPSAYAKGSRIRNDQGVAWTWNMEAGRLLVADLSVELFRLPAPGYLARIPGFSYRYGIHLRNAGTGEHRWSIRTWRKGWQQTANTGISGAPPTRWLQLTRLDLRYRHLQEQGWQFDSRLVLSWFSGTAPRSPDCAAAQQVSWAPSARFKATIQAVLFRVSRWENRIYLYEPGLYHHFDFPVCYGTGEKFAAVVSCRAGSRLTISGKLTARIKNPGGSPSGPAVPLTRTYGLTLQARMRL